MKSSNKIIILSLPRSGSSLLANLISSSGYDPFQSKDSFLLEKSNFNRDGYFEDNVLTLLNDQIIKCVYGEEFSFLHVPTLEVIKEKFKNKEIRTKEYFYDVDDDVVFFPENYEENIERYTGSTYDIWALTRMRKGGKWNKCYSKNNIASFKQIIKKIKEISTEFNLKDNIVLKDPRLSLTIPFFEFVDDVKFIFLTRNEDDCLNSMRKHYGINLFTDKLLPKTNICSNYFNYKIQYQSFQFYYNTFNKCIENFLLNKNFISITYDEILNKKIEHLEDFIERKIDRSIIRLD